MTNSPTRLQRAKLTLRMLAIAFCRRLLSISSRPYDDSGGTTVIVAPHEDDETLACGGLIARKRNEGLPVHIIFITDSSASHPHHPLHNPEAITALRRSEAMKAMFALGVEREAVHFLDEPDGSLKTITPARAESLITRLANRLELLAPNEIFLPCQPDGSSEHDAVFSFVIAALARIKHHAVLWQYPVWCWWNPRLLLRLWWSGNDCRCLPVEDFIPAKNTAVDCYHSQILPLAPDTRPALPPELVSVFRSGVEYFFRCTTQPNPPPNC